MFDIKKITLISAILFNSAVFAGEPIVVSTYIKSTPEKVWSTIMDFENYAKWNTWLVKLKGKPNVGSVVEAFGKSGKSLKLKITKIIPNKTICWVDVSWFTYLGMGGWRCRSIRPSINGVKFVNHFEYTGVFGWVLRSMTRVDLKKGMIKENINLRDYLTGN